MRRLATAVVVHRPAGSVMLPAGAAPSDEDAKLITNPACWIDVDETPAPVADEESTPDASWKAEDIRQWAKARGIDLGSAKKKSDMVAVIAATLPDAPDELEETEELEEPDGPDDSEAPGDQEGADDGGDGDPVGKP